MNRNLTVQIAYDDLQVSPKELQQYVREILTPDADHEVVVGSMPRRFTILGVSVLGWEDMDTP